MLVTFLALGVVALVLLVYIIRNPSTYRLANARLIVVATIIRKDQPDWGTMTREKLQAYAEGIDHTFGTRMVVYSPRRQVLVDSESADKVGITMPSLPRLRPTSVTRDLDGQPWLYEVQQLKNGDWILIAIPRPTIPLKTILTDELMVPVALGAGFAMIVSLLVAFWLARWVGIPLQEIVTASHHMPSGESNGITPQGPKEVQDLARAFNHMNDRVLESQEAQRSFIANVSHELKTPLTSVQGFAQAILDGTASTSDDLHQAAQVIYNESSRMHRMVLDLLDLARLDAGTLEIHYAPVDLGVLLHAITEKLLPQAHGSGVSIQVLSDGVPPILGDGDRLAQVFTNLMDNALKFTSSGGSVTVTVFPVGSSVQVDVSDTGAGIPAASLPHIFERFYQADPSRTGGAHHGTGLGLAIAREIMVAHGGTIDVQSQPGKGTTFHVLLPQNGANIKPRNPGTK